MWACRQCSRVFAGLGVKTQRCAECLRMKPAFDCAVAPFWAGGVVRQVVHQYKYGGKRHLGMLLSEWLGEGWRDERLRDPPADLLVPVPLHWWKRHRRGFNQAEDLAVRLQRNVSGGGAGAAEPAGGPRVLTALRRVRWTDSQTTLGRAERLENLRGVFAVTRGAPIEGRHVLLVDDVLTTGATLDACARVLRKGGVASVRALAVARG